MAGISPGRSAQAPRLGPEGHRECPTADLLFRDEDANDRTAHGPPRATQTRETCRCSAPTPIAWTPQSQPAESENALQVREQHLDTLAVVNSGNFERSPALSSMRRNRFRACQKVWG